MQLRGTSLNLIIGPLMRSLNQLPLVVHPSLGGVPEDVVGHLKLLELDVCLTSSAWRACMELLGAETERLGVDMDRRRAMMGVIHQRTLFCFFLSSLLRHLLPLVFRRRDEPVWMHKHGLGLERHFYLLGARALGGLCEGQGGSSWSVIVQELQRSQKAALN